MENLTVKRCNNRIFLIIIIVLLFGIFLIKFAEYMKSIEPTEQEREKAKQEILNRTNEN